MWPHNPEARITGLVFVTVFGGAMWLLWPSPETAQDAQAVQGQARSCVAPADFAMPRVERARPDQVRRTAVTRYTLALSWSPGFCAQNGDDVDNAMQCGSESGPFGFVLHGLWPETDGRDWPQFCAPTRAIARETLRAHLCMTPSPQLLQHEWARHGSCMAATPEAYFDEAERQYGLVVMPDMTALSANGSPSAGDVRRAFVAANPGLERSMIAVSAGRGGWLDEVRLCLDRRFAWAACPVGERGMSDGARIRVTAQR